MIERSMTARNEQFVRNATPFPILSSITWTTYIQNGKGKP